MVDTYDAITSDRPYRAARSYDVARAEIRKFAGTQFDPRVVEAWESIPAEEWVRIRRELEDDARQASDDGLRPLRPRLASILAARMKSFSDRPPTDVGPDRDVDLVVVDGEVGVVTLGLGQLGHAVDERHGLPEVGETRSAVPACRYSPAG